MKDDIGYLRFSRSGFIDILPAIIFSIVIAVGIAHLGAYWYYKHQNYPDVAKAYVFYTKTNHESTRGDSNTDTGKSINVCKIIDSRKYDYVKECSFDWNNNSQTLNVKLTLKNSMFFNGSDIGIEISNMPKTEYEEYDNANVANLIEVYNK